MDQLYRNFDFMIARIQTLMKEEYKLGRNITRAELRALQAQINPHFLYNTLDLINWGAMDYGADSVAKLARDLGQFYRLTLNHGKSAILIGDEVRHVESYIAIENAHFEDAIELVTEIPEEIASLACLNITLQPFVENSIVHGMAEHPEITTCRIVIRAVREGEDIVFTVSDDGPGIDPKIAESITHAEVPGASTTGYGVSNICFRLKLCYGDSYGVRYLPAGEEGGCTVEIRIQALTMEELEKLLEEE
jgi:two-component system sensor histidine kinase YesM